MTNSKRTTLIMTDERAKLFDQAEAIIATDQADSPPRSDVIDAALTHLIESKANIEKARENGIDPTTIQEIANTSAIRLHYRTAIDPAWRQ